jgi:predicted TIM-barrel fold metal-dependent hydrolase
VEPKRRACYSWGVTEKGYEKEKSVILDGHVHIGAWRESSFSKRVTNVDDAAAVLTQSGVDGALVMPTDEAKNDLLMAELQSHQARAAFRFCAWVDPHDVDNLPWISAQVNGISGLKIHPSLLRMKPTDPVFEPYLNVARVHGLPVLVHCGRWQEMSSWRLGIELANRYRDVNIILCHMGGDSTDLIEATVNAVTAADGPNNVYLGTESIRQYWVVGHAIERLGADRVLFGSDYNLNHPKSFLAVIEAIDLEPSQRSAVLGGNLNRLLPESKRFAVER